MNSNLDKIKNFKVVFFVYKNELRPKYNLIIQRRFSNYGNTSDVTYGNFVRVVLKDRRVIVRISDDDFYVQGSRSARLSSVIGHNRQAHDVTRLAIQRAH